MIRLNHISVSRVLATSFAVSQVLFSAAVQAELTPMEDADLSDVTAGDGIGLLVNDVGIYGDADANVQLTFDTNLADDSAYFDHVSIYGSDSNVACDSNPSATACSGIDIGTVADPVSLNILTESGRTFIELDWVDDPANESGIDAQFRFTTNSFVSAGKIDPSWIHIQDLKLAGTNIRLWSNGPVNSFNVNTNGSINTGSPINGGQPIGFSLAGEIDARFSLTADVATNLGTVGNINIGGATPEYVKLAPFSTDDTPQGDNAGILRLQNVQINNLALGYFPELPFRFGSIDRGANTQPDFFLEVPIVPNNPAIYNAFYANQPKADIIIDNVQLGTAPGQSTPFNVGGARIEGIRIQHLRIETNG